jgi:hypothetical protein
MKFFILTSILLSSTSAFAAYNCPNKVDSKRVVLFVDTNSSAAEAENAAKAACTRGETFKKIPATGQHIDASLLQTEINQLAKNNIAVASMVVSGHDGGGNVHGNRGGIDKTEIISAMKSAYKDKPDLLAQFNSVFMWGCWTMGPSEVDVWRTQLPSLKMAAGFFEMGPLNTTIASRTVLHDLLVKEKSISAESDKAKVKRAIASVEHINQTWAAVYAESCGTDLYYYRTNGDSAPNPDDVNYKPGTHFVEYGKTFSCDGLTADINKNINEIMKYYRGDLPIPENPSNSPLLPIYSFVRSHANCIKPNHVLNGDRILMMRYYGNVKKNFAAAFEEEIALASKEFNHLKSFLSTFNPKGLPMQEFKKYFQGGADKFFNLDAKTLQGKDRKQIREMISYLDGMTKQRQVLMDPKFAGNVKAIKKLKNAMETYLYQMNPNCMDALEWHDYYEGYKPYRNCPI